MIIKKILNKIYNEPDNEIITKQERIKFFENKKLVYGDPLADILKYKELNSLEQFNRTYPLTVKDLINVTKCENETDVDNFIFLIENELSSRTFALIRILKERY